MTVSTTVAQDLSYYTQAIADKRYADAAAAMRELIDQNTAPYGTQLSSGTITTYTANYNAAILLSHQTGAF